MTCTRFNSAVLMTAALLFPAAFAAETPAPPSADTEKTRALEERLKQLEKRLADMESKAKQPNMPQMPQMPPMGGRRFDRGDGNLGALMERLQREMMENGGSLDMDQFFGQGGPGAPGMRGMAPGMSRKPSLGVNIDTVTEELKTRFKNNVDAGSFVMAVYPNSAAEKAGIKVGDAITSYDGKVVANPQSLIEAVKAGGKGTHEVVVSRRGEALMLKVDLLDDPTADATPSAPLLRRENDGNANTSIRTDLHVSALELTDDMATTLKLTPEQKKKMWDVLANHRKLLTDEFDKSSAPRRGSGVYGFSMHGNLTELANKHAENAAKELAGVLNADQLKQWNDYRTTHSSVSFSQTMQMSKTLGGGNAPQLEKNSSSEDAVRF